MTHGKLKELALAATAGPWRTLFLTNVETHDGKLIVSRSTVEDAAYIAAASPDVILALLAENDRLDRALFQCAAWFRAYGDGHFAKGDSDKAQRNYDREAFARTALERK